LARDVVVTDLGATKETEAPIINKLARGTLSSMFFLVCIAALELNGVALEKI
jgi:hypothetical protein